MKNLLRSIFTPACWLLNDRTSETWDKELNLLLDKNAPRDINQFTCKLGQKEVWIANWAHAFGGSYGNRKEGPDWRTPRVLPYRRTMFRLRDAIEKALESQ